MFDENPAVTLLYNQLIILGHKYERGSVIPWDEIEAITGPRYMPTAVVAIKKWRNQHLEKVRSIVTTVPPTVGVRLLTHEQAAHEVPLMGQRKAYRAIRRSLRKVRTVNVDLLTVHQRKLLVSQQHNMQDQAREISRSKKALVLNQATETNPRRRRAPN